MLVGGFSPTHLKNMRKSKWVHLPQVYRGEKLIMEIVKGSWWLIIPYFKEGGGAPSNSHEKTQEAQGRLHKMVLICEKHHS